MDESSSTMSLGDLISDNSPSVVKPKLKKRSFIERQLETNLTEKITSPTISNDGTSTSRYGRALRFKMDVDFCDTDKTVEKSVKSPKFDKSPVKVQSPVYKMHASNSPLRGSPKKHISQSPNMGMSLASNLEDQIENIYNENLSLSRFASNDTLKKESPTKKSTKIYVRKDLIQSREKEETITLIRNMFSPVKSAYKSPKTHIGSTSKRSVDKYSLNSKSQNGYLDTSSVVKALNFDSKNKYKDLKEKPKAVPTKSDIFEMEAKCDYQVGDLTWARVGTYPFWPGIVTRDPLSGTFVKKKMFGRLERDVIHVTFLGDKGRRGWVVDNMLRKYLGVMEFEATREKFTPEDKKKDPKFYAAFFISDKKQAFWNTSIEEAEILLKEPKRLRIDTFNTMLGRVKVTKNTPKRDNPKLNRSNSDVSLSETLYDSLFSVNDNKNNDTVKSKNKSRNSSVDVSEVVTACLDNMAAKTGMTKIKRQSHMDRWLQKAKCTNPETPKTKPQPVVHKSEESKAKKKSMNISTRHTKRNGTQKQMENISYLSENSNHSSVALVDNEQNSVISIDSDSNTNSDSDNLISKRLRNKNRESKTETDLNKSTNSKNNDNDVISSVSDCTIGSTNIQILNQIDGKGVSNVLKDTDLHEIDNDLDKSSLANKETKKIITESEIQNEVTNKIVNKEIMSLNSCDTQTDKTMLKDLCSNVDIEGNHNSNNVDECTRFDVIDSGCTPQTTNCDNTGDTPNLNDDVTVIDKSVKCKNICDDTIKIQIKGKEIEGCSMANHSEDNMCFTKNLIPKISPNNADIVIKDTVFIQDPVSQISDKNDVELMDSDKNVINVDIKENQTKNKHIIIENSLSINNTDKYDKEKPFNDGIILECKSNVENVEDDSMISTQDRNGISQDSVSDTTEVLVSFSNQGNQENNKSLTMDDKLIIKTDNERNTICIPETMININCTENRANGDDNVIQDTLNHGNLKEDCKTYSHDDISMISKNIENSQTINENDVSGFSGGNSQHTKEDGLLNTESLIDDYLNECELKSKHNLIENSEQDIMKNIVDNYDKEYNACGQNVIESQRLVDLNCDTNAKNIESSAISTSNETNDDCLVQKVLKNCVSEENLEKYSVVNENQITENHNNTLRHNVTDDNLNVNNNEVQNIVPIEEFDNDLTKQQKTDVIELKGDSTPESLKSDVIKSPMPIDNGMIRDNGDDRSLSIVNEFKAVLEKSEIIENGHIEKNENNSEGVVKECDPGTPTIKLERCVTPISKRKTRTKSDKIQNVDNNSEKVNVSKALQDREFVTYMEFKQDGLLEENPELTQEEIVTYLYKTWLYEESKKSDFEKTDEIEQSGLIKGLNKDVAPLPKKVKKKAKVEKVEAEVLEEISKEKPKRRVVKPLYNEDIFDFEDEIKLFEIFDKKEPKLKEIAKNSESVDEEFFEIIEDVDDEPLGAKEEIYFEQLTEPKPNLFKGFVREKVCEICEAPTNLVKCKGCHCMFHVACVKKEVETIDAPVLNKGRKKKRKPKGRRPKDGGSIDSESHSDEKSQDVNVSDELNMSIDDIESEFHIVADADTVEALLSAKMKELLENAENIDYNLHYEGELDWSKSIAGKCEIIDVTLKTNVPTNFEDYSDFKCNNCQKYDTPICFVCRSNLSPKNQVEFRQKCQVPQCHRYYHLECLDHWPQTKFSSGEPSKNNKKLNQHFEAISCPRHVCHTCVCDDPRGCKTRFSGDKLARCVKCPATYHSFTKCLPAGTQILTGSHIICPRHYQHRPGKVPCHVNTGWCFICALGGTLICCEYCPTSFHAECLNIKPPEGGYMCEDCETGRLPLYGEMVWVKLGHYRWWPGIILHPSEIPYNILTVKHSPGEFVVRFFGQYDHYWVNRGRVFPFQEGDSGRISKQKSKIDEAFTLAMDHAQRACEILKTLDTNNEEASEINSSLLPPHYVKLKVNKPCGAVSIRRDDEAESLTQCDCDPDLEEPCGPHSQCLNRMLLTECGPSCRAGDRCNNRAFEQRLYPKLEPYRTPHRGWGLRTLEDIKQGQFVIEYVGELIDEEEFQRRMRRKHEQRDENFYFLTLDKERMIDAGPKGNLARFMNHCCEPNCETQKWTVLGDIRVGLFAIYDIPANSEVTFNYNLESAGIEKKQCFCGANRCSGYIGAKPKQEEIPKKIKKTHKKRKALETSPLITKSKPKPRLARVKPKELTEIEKDLLIIQNATNGISSDSETSSRLSSIESDKIFRDTRAIKRKRVDFSIEEVGLHNGGDSPNVKRAKIDDKDAVGDV